MTPPITPLMATARSAGFLPQRSAPKLETIAPATAPACIVVTRLPLMLATAEADFVSRRNSLLQILVSSKDGVKIATSESLAWQERHQ